MLKVQSYEQLRLRVGEVRKQRFITNFFLDPDKHSVWIEKGDCYTELVGQTLFVLRHDVLFWHVYYSSTIIEQLSYDLKIFIEKYPTQTMVLDVVGRKNQCSPVVDMMNSLGWAEATSLVRLTRVSSPIPFTPDPSVRIASEAEIPRISNLLHSFFDPRIEQIPYDVELCSYARQGHVLFCEEGGTIASFLIYEKSNSTLFIRYWFTHPDFRNEGKGARLFRHALEDGKSTNRQILWVIQTNENAIKRYRHYGFNEENMYDFVLKFN